MKNREILIIFAICGGILFFADLLEDGELEELSLYIRGIALLLTVFAFLFVTGIPFMNHPDSHFIKESKDLWILHTPEQPKYILYQTGVFFLTPIVGLHVLTCTLFLGWWILPFELFFVAIGLFALIASTRLKPYFIHFRYSSQEVTFISDKITYSVPFSTIEIFINRVWSGKGRSSHMVVLHSPEKPVNISGDKIDIVRKSSSSPLQTLITMYGYSTRKEAMESIEELNSFMAGTYDKSPSKFDNL
jgi:hypothetical protein